MELVLEHSMVNFPWFCILCSLLEVSSGPDMQLAPEDVVSWGLGGFADAIEFDDFGGWWIPILSRSFN